MNRAESWKAHRRLACTQVVGTRVGTVDAENSAGGREGTLGIHRLHQLVPGMHVHRLGDCHGLSREEGLRNAAFEPPLRESLFRDVVVSVYDALFGLFFGSAGLGAQAHFAGIGSLRYRMANPLSVLVQMHFQFEIF
jgi:hypothetical protein